ncbi:MAG TPA: hypothetical protein VLG17_11635 [Pseudomonas sp.]|nr:hypothetical protein [Pseudomonas sp.]HSX88637.1 hypothetical protein [Pseudomonas sp.]
MQRFHIRQCSSRGHCRYLAAPDFSQQLFGQQEIGLSAKREFTALNQVDADRSTIGGQDSFTGEYGIARGQGTAPAILSDREHFTHNLPDGTDQRGHISLRINW